MLFVGGVLIASCQQQTKLEHLSLLGRMVLKLQKEQ